MDNNNSIPYGTISWDNEDAISATRQQRETQMIHPPRNYNTGTRNGLRHSLRGPQYPPPQQGTRESVVGFLRNSDLLSNRSSSRFQQGQTNYSNVQHRVNPITSTSSLDQTSGIQNERFFSLRPLPSQNSSRSNVESEPSPGMNSTFDDQNTHLSSSSVNQQLTSLSQYPRLSASSNNDTAIVATSCHNEAVSRERNRRNLEGFHASRAKRRSSHLAENDNVSEGPSCKQFLSEEKMAARMHNLRISNDHSYLMNRMPLFIDWSTPDSTTGNSGGQGHRDDSNDDENKEKTEKRNQGLPVFILDPQVKDAMTKENAILPEAIFNQLSKPCLAVVPWKGPNESLTAFSIENKNNNLEKSEDDSRNSNLVIESVPETEQFIDQGVHHVEIVGECNTFSFEDEDMEL